MTFRTALTQTIQAVKVRGLARDRAPWPLKRGATLPPSRRETSDDPVEDRGLMVRADSHCLLAGLPAHHGWWTAPSPLPPATLRAGALLFAVLRWRLSANDL